MGINAAIFGGNWDETSNSGSRASNWNNSPTNSNNNIGARGVCEDISNTLSLCCGYGTAGRPYLVWSAILSCFGKYLWGFRKTASSQLKTCVKVVSGLLIGALMGKKYKHLIEQIADIDNLRSAFAKTSSGKRMTWGYLEFKEYAELNLLNLRADILSGSWVQGAFREFIVYEPKQRTISALQFKDRVAQHALVNIIGPIFDRTLLPGTHACRLGMGTHTGVKHVQSALRRTGHTHFLKTDYSKFFYSVDRRVLHGLIRKKISCQRTLRLIEAMLPATGVGIPIGSLSSQLFANVYGGVIDRFIHFELGAREWTRYMDDIVILSSNPYELRQWFEEIKAVSKKELGLGISHWQVSPVTHGINFLGYRIWPRHKLLRKASVTSAKRKIARYTKYKETDALKKFIASWRGHAAHADTCNLFNHLKETYDINLH
jgi:retron-type reverse transcriptase